MKLVALFLVVGLSSGVARAETATIGSLTIDVPAGFTAQAKHELDSLGDLEVNRWASADGHVVELLYYAGFPKQDRGPMHIANQEAIEVAGQETSLIETEVFFGQPKRVLVVYVRYGESIYIIDSEGMSKSDFKRLLMSIRLAKKEANQSPQPTAQSRRG